MTHLSPHIVIVMCVRWELLKFIVSNFQIYNTVLIIGIMLYVTSSELFRVITGNIYPSTTFNIFSLSQTSCMFVFYKLHYLIIINEVFLIYLISCIYGIYKSRYCISKMWLFQDQAKNRQIASLYLKFNLNLRWVCLKHHVTAFLFLF